MQRLPRRHPEMVRAARELFLAEGFDGVSVERIAETARVSKQSVYGAFGDKRGLFVEAMTAMVNEAGDQVAEQVARLPLSADLAEALADLARAQLRLVMRPEMLRLRRSVIGEAERFPELAAAFYERGPGRTIAALTELFTRLSSIGDPAAAAKRFNWLVMAEPVNQAMFLRLGEPPSDTRIDQWATEAVAAFLAIYPEAQEGSP